MRRAATFLLVAAVLAVGVAAAVDGVRGGGAAQPEQTRAVETGPRVVDAEEGDEPAELTVGASVSVERPAGIAVAAGSVWVASRGALVRIDPAQASVTRSILLGGRPGAVVEGQGSVYVLDQLTSDAIRIDPGAESIAGRLDADVPVLDVAFADGDAWIPDPGGSAVLRVDPASGTVGASISVPAPTDVVAAAGEIWALSPEAGVVSHIDPASNLVSTIPLDDPPGQLAVAGGAVWVSHPDGRRALPHRRGPGRGRSPDRARLRPAADRRRPCRPLGSRRRASCLGRGGTGRVTGTLTLELARPPGPQPAILGGIAAGEGDVWIADTYGDSVLRVAAPS